MDQPSCGERVASALAPYLGAFNAKVTVKTFATRSLGRPPDTLTSADLPALLEALRPTLYTLVGREAAASLIDAIAREVS